VREMLVRFEPGPCIGFQAFLFVFSAKLRVEITAVSGKLEKVKTFCACTTLDEVIAIISFG
jgi:hypothetical protein